jgi:hypothetical protein
MVDHAQRTISAGAKGMTHNRRGSRPWRRRLARAVAAPLLVGALLFPGVAAAEGGWNPNTVPYNDGTWTKSKNWAGIAHQSSLSNPASGYVSDVKGQWVVPALACVAGAPAATASIWVGMDGFTDGSTVEQIGTQHTCTDGAASYSAFYQMYPNPPTQINLAVKPGDLVSARVTYAGFGKFALSLSNLTTKKSYATTQTSWAAPRKSAEFVVEAQTVDGAITPLADVGTVTFTNTSTTLSQKGGSATVIDMINAPGNVLADSAGYQVTWKQAS